MGTALQLTLTWSLTPHPPTMQHLLSTQHLSSTTLPRLLTLPLSFMLLLSFTLPLWLTVLLFTIPQLLPPSTLPPFTVEPGKCPTSQCPSLTRVSTGPPPSPRPSEPTSLLSMTLPAPSTELTVGVRLLPTSAMLVMLPMQLLTTAQ